MENTETIRAYRQDRLNRKIAKFRMWADSAVRKADALRAQNEPYMSDYAFVTQPILAGHHSERRHRNLKNRINARIDKEMTFRNRADELRKKADWLEGTGARVKGDAEREREEKRKILDTQITVGSAIYDFCFREGVVTRVNKKTYSIHFASGFKCTRDKTYVQPVQSTGPKKDCVDCKREQDEYSARYCTACWNAGGEQLDAIERAKIDGVDKSTLAPTLAIS